MKFQSKALMSALLGATILCAPSSYASDLEASSQADLRGAIARDYDANLKDLFTHFHTNPELSHREFKTAARIAKELKALGFNVSEGIGGTGVVAVMKNGAGPTVMLRADMDGLPVKEDTGLAYSSTAKQVDIDDIEKPVMHACGHDVHITSLVGTGRQMAALKNQWSGTLVLIGQPAEERISGARDMLKDGLYKKFPKPDYALAFHISASVPTGKIQLSHDVVSSSSDSVDIIVHGVGAHGASPHKGVDPILVASQIVVSLQSIVSRTIAPLKPGVITVGAFHGGFKHNIISDKVEMQLTVRSDNPEVREKLLDGIDRVAKGVAISMGVPNDKLPEVIRSKTETTPSLANDGETAQTIHTAFAQNFGDDIFYTVPRSDMGAEDFAYFVAPETGVKGVYFSVGGTPKKDMKKAPSHHSPFFKIDPEPSIKLGTEAMVVGALTLLAKK
ncbi:MAG: peptidase M20 [Robiginitomaculum sp.]|nr:MAG: peptidase M20 [Robiginitomaculum sp.]